MYDSCKKEIGARSRAPEFADLARRYCELIEDAGTEGISWLKEVASLLPRLHASVNSLDGHAYGGNAILTPDLDTRFELYIKLLERLGDLDPYWLEFDRVDDADLMTGSLADDLTDIYCELKHGLVRITENPEYSSKAWREGFTRHWCRHLADATRHLSALESEGRLD